VVLGATVVEIDRDRELEINLEEAQEVSKPDGRETTPWENKAIYSVEEGEGKLRLVQL